VTSSRNWSELEGPSSLTRLRLITKFLHKYKLGGKGIDIGCRTGTLAKALNNHFKYLVGIDISRPAIDEATRSFPSGNFYVADITDLMSLPKTLFDVAICSDVLEHIEEDVTALQNTNRILKPDGYLILTTPSGMKNWTRHDDWAHHVRRYEPDELQKKLCQAGFDVEEIFTWGYPVYNAYYELFLQRLNPKKAKTWKTRSHTREMSFHFLSKLFALDDLFVWTDRGRRLFAVATKRESE